MAKVLTKIETEPQPSPAEETPLRSLVRRVAQDAARRASTYREDTIVPGGGE